jgi:hypothetical protein
LHSNEDADKSQIAQPSLLLKSIHDVFPWAASYLKPAPHGTVLSSVRKTSKVSLSQKMGLNIGIGNWSDRDSIDLPVAMING